MKINIFRKNNIVNSKTLAESSSAILSLFTKTATELQILVDNAKNQAKVKQEEANQALAEKAELEKFADKHTQIISNLSNILG